MSRKRCIYCQKYNGDGCEDTDGHDFYSCEVMNNKDLEKYGRYDSFENEVLPEECEQYLCETCRYRKERYLKGE